MKFLVPVLLAGCLATSPLLGDTATGFARGQTDGFAYPFSCNQESLSADFAARDQLSQSAVPVTQWYATNSDGRYLNRGWGPAANALPHPSIPQNAGCDSTTWMQERVLTVAMRYVYAPDNPLGLQYRHHHIPGWNPPTSTYAGAPEENPDPEATPEAIAWDSGRGLDCSNFTAWVYNYGLGVAFNGNVGDQFAGTAGAMGTAIPKEGPFEPGDLLYLHPDRNTAEASHVVVYVDDQHIIDSRIDAQNLVGVQVRNRVGWYRTAVLSAWRPIG